MISKNLKTIASIMLWVSLGVYTGCSSNDEPQPVDCKTSTLAVSSTSTNPTSCAATDGSISATATGGEGPYQFELNAQPYAAASNYTGLGAGVYELKVKDSNGCERTKSVTVNAPGSTLAASFSLVDSGCKTTNGTVTVNATGGTGPYTYSFNNGAATASAVFANVAAGTYPVKVIDNTGCSTTQSVKVLSGTKYSTQVKSIIDTNCAITGCHVAGGAAPITWTTIENVQSRAADIKAKTQSGEMPKGGPKLPQAQLDLIACWVDDGALNN
ncbi:MAG TPA: SprB repeat-containing protein [Cyclobacteriaceae bacterium]|nr:SprB repeat-containing protein [Cyclobacteriaceae bacterium]